VKTYWGLVRTAYGERRKPTAIRIGTWELKDRVKFLEEANLVKDQNGRGLKGTSENGRDIPCRQEDW